MLPMSDAVRAIIERALAIAAEHHVKHGTPHAEIAADRAHWYMLRVKPGRELSVAAHLAGRRFGVYVPMGHKGGPRECPIFPGYVFAFVWGIDKQWGRIRSCPDVTGITRNSSDQFVIIPDDMIDDLQSIEFKPIAKELVPQIVRRKRGKKGRVVEVIQQGDLSDYEAVLSTNPLPRERGLTHEGDSPHTPPRPVSADLPLGVA